MDLRKLPELRELMIDELDFASGAHPYEEFAFEYTERKSDALAAAVDAGTGLVTGRRTHG